MDKIVIGLTGKYCAGKNHVAFLLEKRGIPVLDADKMGHLVIETEKARIIARFGGDITGKDGTINRKALGAKVFGKPGELADLEAIIHPAVNRETLVWINSRKEKACVVNAALLHRSSAFGDLSAILLVEAPLVTRLLRAKKRDKLPWTAIVKRFRSQAKFNTQYLRGKADIYRVSNTSACMISGIFGSGKQKPQIKLENRIDEILSLIGIK